MILTLDDLKKLSPGDIIAMGEGLYPSLSNQFFIKWIAVRGGIHDWAIYYHLSEHPDYYIICNGDKVFTKDVIKQLVPCTDEALDMYRY